MEEGFVASTVRPSRSGVWSVARFAIAASFLAIAFMAVPASAQILYGSVVGTVKDSTGSVLPGATVTIVNKETNLTREAVTNSDGAYSIINVQPGPYDIKVTLTGFRDMARYNVPVTIGDIARFDVAMEVGSVTESVLVVGESPLLQTDKADVSHGIQVGNHHAAAAQQVPQLSGADQPGAGHDADVVRQRGNRYAGPVDGDQHQRAGEHAEFDAHRRRDEYEHLAAEPHHVHLAGRDGRHRERVDQQLRRRAGDGGRRGGDGRHQVGH